MFAVANMEIATRSCLLQNHDMLIDETRLKNLKLKLHEFGGKQKDFAAKIGTSPNSLNQYLTSHRKIGVKGARGIEKNLGLSHGWMDQPHIKEWEVANILQSDRNVRFLARHQIGTSIAMRIDALLDDRAVRQITSLLEFLEDQQRSSLKHLSRPPGESEKENKQDGLHDDRDRPSTLPKPR